MTFRNRHRPLTLLCAGLTLELLACTPKIISTSGLGGPNTSTEMAQDLDRLDKLLATGKLSYEELLRGRDRYQSLVDELRARDTRDEGLRTLALKEAELSLTYYTDLLNIAVLPATTRTERADMLLAIQARQHQYLKELSVLKDDVDLGPALSSDFGNEPSVRMVESSLPPPSSQRLLAMWRAGQKDQVVKEVEGVGVSNFTSQDSQLLLFYALALGSQQKYDQAASVAAELTARPLLLPEALEVRYLSVLWLLKLGQNDQASASLKAALPALVSSSAQLAATQPSLLALADDLEHGSKTYLQASLDIRLALASGDYEAARTQCRALLVTETAVDSVNRIEALLSLTDTLEEAAFEAAIASLSVSEGGVQARTQALEAVAARFPSARYQARIEETRRRLGLPAPAPKSAGTESATGGAGSPASPDPKTADPKTADPKTADPKTVGSSPADTKTVAPPPTGSPAGPERTSTPIANASSVTAQGSAAGGSTPSQPAPTSTGPVEAPSASASKPSTAASGSAASGAAATPGATPTGTPAASSPAPASVPAGTPAATPAPLPPAATPAPLPPAATPAPLPPADPALMAVLEQGEALYTSGKYVEAIAELRKLQGTALEAQAAPLELKAIDRHVQQVRERVVRDYVKVQQSKDPKQKAALVLELYTSLKNTLDTYPQTTLKDKANHNLLVFATELDKLDPGWRQRSGGGETAPSGTGP